MSAYRLPGHLARAASRAADPDSLAVAADRQRAGSAAVVTSDGLDEFWSGFLRIGFVVLGLESLTVDVYAYVPATHPHAALLTWAGCTFGALALCGIATSRALARMAWRARLALVGSLVSGVALTGLASADGGLDSPLAIWLLLPVVYVAAALPARAVVAVTCTAVAELAVLGALDADLSATDRTDLTLFGLLVGATLLGIVAARQRDRVHRHEAVLTKALDRAFEVDLLTGCTNFATYQHRLSQEIEQALRSGGVLSILACDVDNLRAFNAVYGDRAGDQAIVTVAEDLTGAVGPDDVVTRAGGDEFAVLLPGRTADEAEAVARQVLTARDGRGIRPTVSIGVAQLDPKRPTALRLQRDADNALLHAKAQGGGVSNSHDLSDTLGEASPSSRVDTRAVMEAAFRHTLREMDELRSVTDTLLDDAPVGLAFVDRDGRVILTNKAVRAALGATIEPVGQRVADFAPGAWSRVAPHFARVLRTDQPVIGVEVGSGDGSAGSGIAWLANLYPVHVGSDVLGVGFVAMDISDRKRLERMQRDLTGSVVRAVAATAEARDPYTAGHQARVSEIAVLIATWLGLGEDEVEGIGLAAAIHDIGKVAVPAEVLSRPGRLRPQEFELIQVHPQTGAEILDGLTFPWPVAEMILQHHERFDGSGYPNQLSGTDILLGARIIAVADVLEAMASYRPYRPALGLDAAIAEITKGRGTLFDPAVVDACLALHAEGKLDRFAPDVRALGSPA